MTEEQERFFHSERRKLHVVDVKLTEIEMGERPASEALGLLKVTYSIALKMSMLLQHKPKV